MQAPTLAWTPACLLRGTLCIERLHADKVELNFPPNVPAPDAPASTEPTLAAPVVLPTPPLPSTPIL